MLPGILHASLLKALLVLLIKESYFLVFAGSLIWATFCSVLCVGELL